MSPPITFRTLPGQDELSEVPRDLSFHPRVNSAPTVLRPEQIDRFNRDGYVKPIRIYSAAEIADIRRYFDDLLARYVAEGKDSYAISSAHLRHGPV